MGNTWRWAAAVLGYSLILLVVAATAMSLAWACHHVPSSPNNLLCNEHFLRYGGVLIFAIIILGHSLAAVLAVALAPTHARLVGIVAVACPFAIVMPSIWSAPKGLFNATEGCVAPLLMAVPVIICTYIVVRRKEIRQRAES